MTSVEELSKLVQQLQDENKDLQSRILKLTAERNTAASQTSKWNLPLLKNASPAVTKPNTTQPPTKKRNVDELNSSTDSEEGKQGGSDHSSAKAEMKPPPIYVNGIVNMREFEKFLSSEVKQCPRKALANGDLKISCANVDQYRLLMGSLSEEVKHRKNQGMGKITYHTYQLKQDKPYVVYARNLHPTTDIEEIKENLLESGHVVRNIINVKAKRKINNKSVLMPLSLFRIELEPNSNNRNIYEVTHILYHKIKIEPPRSKKELPQCTNCQQIGHTKGYCARQPKCVKCGKNHHTTLCRKALNDPCKCANCGGEHTANWRGCPFYQSKVNATLKPKQTVTQRTQQKTNKPATKITDGKSYAAVTTPRSRQAVEVASQSKEGEPTLRDMYNLLIELRSNMSLQNERITRLEIDRQQSKKDTLRNKTWQIQH